MTSEAIQTKELCKSYGPIYAVKKLNLNIPTGITYGLLGPNGAGKTTIIRMLNGLIKPTSGTANVLDFDIIRQSRNVKQNCGFLPESPGLYEKLTAYEFLEFIGELYSVPSSVLSTRIPELIALFGLDGRENELLEGYSRGMKQKMCLCSTLIQDPKILFLDEPTSNLDPSASRMVKDLISDLTKKADKTIFLCTHLLELAEELCDVIGIIKDGELILEGTPKDIMTKTDTSDLEQAYIKIMDIKQKEDLLAWREE
jgi:ABC-2 type transport system ATP-binding protein